MGCGGCGGINAIKVMRTQAREVKSPRPIPAPTLRPRSTTKIVVSSLKPDTTSVTIKARQRAKDMKLCPLCGATLSIIIAGSGARNRRRCSHCDRVFA